MKKLYPAIFLSVAVGVLSGCAQETVADEPTPSTRNAPPVSTVAAPAEDTFAIGSHLTPQGAVASPSVREEFNRGENVFLSIDLDGSSQPRRDVEVRWQSDRGELRRDRTIVDTKRRRYATFESGMTSSWSPGAYRAVIVIDGREVAKRPFEVR